MLLKEWMSRISTEESILPLLSHLGPTFPIYLFFRSCQVLIELLPFPYGDHTFPFLLSLIWRVGFNFNSSLCPYIPLLNVFLSVKSWLHPFPYGGHKCPIYLPIIWRVYFTSTPKSCFCIPPLIVFLSVESWLHPLPHGGHKFPIYLPINWRVNFTSNSSSCPTFPL